MTEPRTADRWFCPRTFWLLVAGVMLVQVAWIAALPTFRGADEFDHVYKADAVAHGQLRGTVEAARGRGQLLEVRSGVVAAAGPVCELYSYTGVDNCRPVADAGEGRVQIASAAASYNPSYYLVAGVVARPFDGVGFDLALRLVTAALTALLVAAAAAVARARARTAWPLLALGVSVTPTLLYSGAVAAPNGVGYAAAVLWWVCALAIVQSTSAPARRLPWVLLTVASLVVLGTHTLNVMWLPLITLSVLLLRPWRWWSAALRSPAALVSVSLVATASLACVAWIRLADTNALPDPGPDAERFPVEALPTQQLVWGLQTIASFPLRDQHEHPAVYALWLLVLVPLLVAGVRVGTARHRRVLALLLLSWLAVPAALTVVSYASEGFAWQGRYALPVAIGLVLVAGAGLDRAATPLPEAPLHLAAVVLAGVHVWCIASVTIAQSGLGAGLALADALPLPLAVALNVAVATLGVLVVLSALRRPCAPAPMPHPVTVA